MIQVNFNGRLGADAELRKSKEGKEFITFNVAVNEKRNGERKTTWMRVVSDNTKITQYLKKGSLVFVSGNEDVNTFINKNGETLVSRDVRAHSIDFISIGLQNTDNTNNTNNNSTTNSEESSMNCGTFKPQVPVMASASSNNDNDDDLPF